MRFAFDLTVDAPAAHTARALADPEFLVVPRGDTPIGDPELIDHVSNDGVEVIRIRWAFVGELNAAARALLDPAKLTWIQESRHDVANGRATFRILPDHYADRLRCEGRYRVVPDPDDVDQAARVAVEGQVEVRARLVGGQVERVLVDGLRAVLRAQCDAITDAR